MRIALEGMDGVGKSTVAKSLEKKLGYKHFDQKIIDKYGMTKESYNKLIKNIRSSKNKKMSAIFYILKCMLDLNDDEIENSITERSVVSMFYFEHYNFKESEWDLIMSLGIIPDLTIILYASQEERIKRIKKRNPNDPDLVNREALEYGYDVMLDFSEKYNVPYVVIDTTSRTLKEVIVICETIIKQYEKCPDSKKKEYLEKINSTYGFKDEDGKVKKYEK